MFQMSILGEHFCWVLGLGLYWINSLLLNVSQAKFYCVDGDGTVPCESAMVCETLFLYIQNFVAVCHSQCVHCFFLSP